MTLLRYVTRHLMNFSPLSRRRLFSTESLSHRSNKTQIYTLSSRNPFLNLSIEHHLFQHTPPDSTILLFYTNSPCIVIGRNQNPWLEVNLSLLAKIRDAPGSVRWTDEPVQLVRRRSGGGAVFHDEGNVNFSVICPPEAFDRDKHAEMVVRALKKLGKGTTRVNERHDIVMDVAPENGIKTFKVSGSAYKLTRLRSVHHGTCLLESPNLRNISGMLRSPAEPFIKARGVESVRSPVRNVGLSTMDFSEAVKQEFRKMYGSPDVEEDVGEEALEITKLSASCQELQSRDWIFGQTPRFTFSTHPTQEDPRERTRLPFDHNLSLEARHGLIEQFDIRTGATDQSAIDASSLRESSLYNVDDWKTKLQSMENSDLIGQWMNQMLGTNFVSSKS